MLLVCHVYQVKCLTDVYVQDIDVESLMQEIRQWNPPEQPEPSAAHIAATDSGTQQDVEASPSSQGIGLLPVASPAPSSSPDRSQSHAAASTSSSSHKVQSYVVQVSPAPSVRDKIGSQVHRLCPQRLLPAAAIVC